MLHELGTSVTDTADNEWIPMHFPAQGGKVESIRVLHELGASVTDADGWTPINFAAHGGKVESIRVLHEFGADPNPADNEERTPLQVAGDAGEIKAAKALLFAGADPDRTTENLLLESRDNPELVQALLLYGANPLPALTQIHERHLRGSAVAMIRRWPLVPPLAALCLRVVERERIRTDGLSPMLLMMPDPKRVIAREDRRREREDELNERKRKQPSEIGNDESRKSQH